MTAVDGSRATSADADLIAEAEGRAASFLAASTPTREEAARARRLARLLADDDGMDLLLDLTDQVMRIRDPRRSAVRLHDLTSGGVPASLGPVDGTGLRALGALAPRGPRTAQRLVSWRVDRDTSGVILPADDPDFAEYLARRKAEGFRLNVNILGEAILGDREAEERARRVEVLIRRPDVDYVSVKISAVCANLDVLAWEHSVTRIEEQLVRLYRAARDSRPRSFVNLDMEEYRDLELSVASFMRVLDREEFQDLSAGIVLQAYIPDSHAALERLCAWANDRVRRGGAGIKIRLVKGANLANEQVEAETHDWPLATYPTKHDVDASYKRMLESALALGDPQAVRIGVASHNLLEVGWALALRDSRPDGHRIEIEMLEGMAPPQARAVRDAAGDLLLYAPVVARADREASIAYLSRRLDENAAPENFLQALFTIAPGSPTWDEQVARFRAAVRDRSTVSVAPRRVQDRTRPAPASLVDGSFHNCVDTDFTVPANREWIAAALEHTAIPAPTVVDEPAAVDDLVQRALRAQEKWATTSWAERRQVLAAMADAMEAHRGQTLAIMAGTVGKTVREGDPEVSEAIDFATYAAHLTVAHEEFERDGATWRPHRLVVVAGPWNFPYAIPASGLVHAVAAGSAVILKPAPQARAVAAALVEHLTVLGVPEGLIQLACTPDDEVGQHLITHPDVDLVMLTGSYDTAALFTGWKPSLRLLGETSGKNAIIITQAADLDVAIKDLVKSAFGHAGQKCSAASLAIVEAPVYDDPDFQARLADAVSSLTAGDATKSATIMGPLIEAPSMKLERGLTTLEPGERWLVEPRCLDAEAHVWTPGVRLGVRAGSWFHLTECFGPVLGLMRAPDLDTAITWQNQVDYGLTGGIHSLDPTEIETWLARVEVGNAYVNRHITGAIVQRQPFGGWKKSSIGAGSKPGGPGHLDSYGTWSATVGDVATVRQDFARTWATFFCAEHDPTGMAAEANILRYRPVDQVVVRADDAGDDAVRLLRMVAEVTGVPLVVSDASAENEEALIARLCSRAGQRAVRLRLLTHATDAVHSAAFSAGIAVDRSTATAIPMIELRRWVIEQAVSRTMHRHGRLVRRSRSKVALLARSLARP
jgi:RHH-type proline utilization regulon transcriptional repressor/proline dehydrogenase/delta 1-pyrroline-5-carboxylate dehydrogenase